MKLKLEEGEIHLYIRDIRNLSFQEEDLKTLLTEEELLRGEKIQGKEARKKFFSCRIFVKKTLKNYFDDSELSSVPVFSYGEEGRPFLKDIPHLHFNFSHTHQGLFLAVSLQSVGIDAEYKKRHEKKSLTHLNRLFKFLDKDCPDDFIKSREEFFIKWTKMEAMLKFHGLGLGKGKFTFQGGEKEIPCFQIITQRRDFKDYTIHVASKIKNPHISHF